LARAEPADSGTGLAFAVLYTLAALPDADEPRSPAQETDDDGVRPPGDDA
jgi:hypothetical protein